MTRTLADMTPAERAACVGRWAEWTPVEDQTVLVVIEEVHQVRDYAGCVIPGVRYIEIPRHRLRSITPRFDLPRAWTPTGEPVTEDAPEPGQSQPEDVKPEPSPTRPVTLTTESELLLAPLGTIIRGPETWDFYPYTKWAADEWVGANESKRFTDKAGHMAGKEWTVLYMPGVGS